MKLVSSLALGVALIAGVASPALAQKKEKPAAAPAMQLSKGFRAAAGPAQEALKGTDLAVAETQVAAAEAAATTPDDKFVAGQLRLQLGGTLKNTAMQQKAVIAMLDSGSALSTADRPRLNFYAGQAAYQANDFAKALTYLTEAQRLGFSPTDTSLLLAETNFKSNNVPAGLAEVEKAIAASDAAGTKAPEAWYARAASVAYKAKLMNEAGKWTRAQVRAYPTVENWRSALVIYRDGATRDSQLNLDIFRLMRVTKSLAGERDYFEMAALAADRGLPGEAKSILDEGTAVSAFPAGSRPIAELRATVAPKVAADRTSLPASERQAGSAANGRVALATADAYLGYGDDAKAAALYRLALTKGGVDVDAVNTRLGIALARSGQKADAKAAFAAVKGARSEIAAFWMLWLDQQA